MLISVRTRSIGYQVVGVAREEDVTTVSAHPFSRRAKRKKSRPTAIGARAIHTHQGRLARHQVSHEDVARSVSIVGHEIAGKAGEHHVTSIVADPATVREIIPAAVTRKVNVDHLSGAGE